MSYTPRLYTPRLCLRPFTLADAPRVRELAGDARIASTVLHIPHPYPEGAAERWIQSHAPLAAAGLQFKFAVTLTGTRTPGRELDPTDTGHLIGAIGLVVENDLEQSRGELGYWIGVHYWNRGFATEAGRAVLEFAFARRHLHRVSANHFAGNPASGRVLQKLGMTCEGVLRAHEYKDGAYQDVACYAVLEEEWASGRRTRKTPVSKVLQPA